MTTDITTLAPTDLVAILTTPEKFDDLIGTIKAEVAAHSYDLTTKKGRDAIKSLAYKVTRTKTALDEAGKELNAGKRAEINAVDEVRRKVREDLDTLAADARKPLDEWEQAEGDRQTKIAVTMLFIDDAREVSADDTSADIQDQINRLTECVFDADIFQDALELAVNAKASAIEFLTAAKGRATRAEADAAELAELRRKDAERIEADRIASEAAAQIEADRIAEDARVAEAARIEAQRIADAEAAETKRLADISAAEQRAAEAATAEAARIAQVAIDAANAEAETLRHAEAVRQAAADRAASEQAAREADKAHRGAVMKAAKEAIIEYGGVTEDAARKIVLAIVAGEIPNVTVKF